MSEMSMADRKRLRDRRSQQNMRDKKLRHIAKLEEQVAHCEQHHNDRAVQHLLQLIKGLRRQNETLKSRQKRLKSLFNSWNEDPEVVVLTASDPDRQHLEPFQLSQNGCHDRGPISFGEADSSAMVLSCPSTQSTPKTPPLLQTAVESPKGTDSPWSRVPLNDDDFSDPKRVSCPWLVYLEQIMPCPNTPSSPLDILYGSKANPLADQIHTAIQRRPVRDPERLALGWLAYHMTRWSISPSSETYDRLPPFLRPIEDQFQIPHPASLDAIPWPKLRQNLILHWNLYRDQRDEVFGMLACCAKVRWPWGVDVLERNAENELCIKPQFYETFMSLEGWGLTPEFISRYPDLVSGIDMNSILFNVI